MRRQAWGIGKTLIDGIGIPPLLRLERRVGFRSEVMGGGMAESRGSVTDRRRWRCSGSRAHWQTANRGQTILDATSVAIRNCYADRAASDIA